MATVSRKVLIQIFDALGISHTPKLSVSRAQKKLARHVEKEGLGAITKWSKSQTAALEELGHLSDDDEDESDDDADEDEDSDSDDSDDSDESDDSSDDDGDESDADDSDDSDDDEESKDEDGPEMEESKDEDGPEMEEVSCPRCKGTGKCMRKVPKGITPREKAFDLMKRLMDEGKSKAEIHEAFAKRFKYGKHKDDPKWIRKRIRLYKAQVIVAQEEEEDEDDAPAPTPKPKKDKKKGKGKGKKGKKKDK